jgi:predicted esterase
VYIITELLKKEIKILGDSKKVFIGGYSQGASIALATFLQFSEGALGGLACYSGLMCTNIDWERVDLQLKKETPMFFYHGELDAMWPLDLAQRSYEEVLKANGVEHMQMIVEEGLQHQMSLGGIQHLKNFLTPLIDPEWVPEKKTPNNAD